jgi:hypothetical protein
MSDRHPLIVWMQREEDLACKNADLVVSILPLTRPYLVSRGLNPEKWTHVQNGVPEDAVGNVTEPPGGDILRVGYFGGHGKANDLWTLIEAARILRDQPIEFRLVGSGPEKIDLMSSASDLDHVEFMDPVSPGEARTLMRNMDLLYHGSPHTSLYAHGLSPNKLFEYLAAGRMVLQANEPPWAPEGSSGSFLINARSGHAPSVAGAIQRAARMTPQQRREQGIQAHDYAAASCTYPRLATSFVDAIGRKRNVSENVH